MIRGKTVGRSEVIDDDREDEEWDVPPEPGTFTIGLEGRLWNVDRFYELEGVLPEKMELIEGKLFGAERYRLGMLSAMLEQVGLAKAVTLAPKGLWLEALRRLEE
jgi:hypothetical protein